MAAAKMIVKPVVVVVVVRVIGTELVGAVVW